MVSKDAKDYLQVDLEELFVVTGARTQGRFGNGQGQEYTEEYMMDYWRPGFIKWTRWKNRVGKSVNTCLYLCFTAHIQEFVVVRFQSGFHYSFHPPKNSFKLNKLLGFHSGIVKPRASEIAVSAVRVSIDLMKSEIAATNSGNTYVYSSF